MSLPATPNSEPPASGNPHATRFQDLRHDVSAGLLLAGLLVPQGMAYAGVAGISPQRGLYAALAGLVVYALLGSGRHVVVAPTSSAAALLAAAVVPIAGGDAARLEVLGSALAIVTGFVLLSSAVLKLGAISDFVSRPVLEGFMVGLAITVIVKQVPRSWARRPCTESSSRRCGRSLRAPPMPTY